MSDWIDYRADTCAITQLDTELRRGITTRIPVRRRRVNWAVIASWLVVLCVGLLWGIVLWQALQVVAR